MPETYRCGMELACRPQGQRAAERYMTLASEAVWALGRCPRTRSDLYTGMQGMGVTSKG